MTLPYNEPDRQRELDAMRLIELLPQAVYDDIAKLASSACGTPVALVSLLDRERQWFKAHIGTDEKETSRDIAFCEHAIRQPTRLLEVKDARVDQRFAANPLVTAGPGIRFYAGMPLVTPSGHAVGTVCVWDTAPRELEDEQREALAALARLTVHIMDTHRREQSLQRQVLLEQALVDAAVQSAPAATVADAVEGFAVLIIELQRMANWVSSRGERHVERVLGELEQSVEQILQRHGGGHASRVSGSGELIVLILGQDRDLAREVIEAHVGSTGKLHDVEFLCAAATSGDASERPESVYLRADIALSGAKDRLDGTWTA